MGANLLIVVATVALHPFQQDTLVHTAAPAVRQVAHRWSARDSTPTDMDQPAHGFAFERLPDLLQYNRVQGLSGGLGYRVRVPGIRHTSLYGTVRYGLSDDRVAGRLTILRQGPGGRLVLSGYHDIADLDPFSPGRTFSNTLNGLFAGHDNGDYALARGGSLSVGTRVGAGLELNLSAKVERQSSLRQVAQSVVNDFLGGTGLFPPNPPVDEGTFGVASVRLSGVGATRWNLTADALGGAGQTTGRLFGDVKWRIGSHQGITLRAKAGAATGPARPQTLFRLGGVNTVRGFEYGTFRGPAIWAAQVDVAPLDGRVRPILFLDAGQAASVSNLFSSPALVGGGVGVSFLRGLVRFDLSHPITPHQNGKLRFDLVVRGVR